MCWDEVATPKGEAWWEQMEACDWPRRPDSICEIEQLPVWVLQREPLIDLAFAPGWPDRNEVEWFISDDCGRTLAEVTEEQAFALIRGELQVNTLLGGLQAA